MAKPHAQDLSGSKWFHTACVACRLGSGGEGGSSPEAGGQDGESVAIELQSGHHVYFIGAIGETSLQKVEVEAVEGDSAGIILRIVCGLWESFRLFKMNTTLYHKAYYLMKGRGDLSLVWCFTSVVLACADAKKRQQVIPAMVRVACLFAVVLKGLAFVTVDGCKCIMLLPGVAHFVCPGAPVRVEVEGHTVVLLAYTSMVDGSSTKKSAKRRASVLVDAMDAARRAATRRADKIRKKKTRKPIPEPAPITDTDVEEHEGEARASPKQKIRTKPVPESAPITEAVLADDERGARAPPVAFADPSEGNDEREARASPVTVPGPPIGSLVWPWDEGSLVVHRLACGCQALSPATIARWAQSVRSWREPWHQVLWLYKASDAALLGVDSTAHSAVLIRDASIVISEVEWSKWQAKGMPIPLIKDMFQLKCLHMFGGWWADMDYFMLNAKAPSPRWSSWMVGADYERRSGAYAKVQSRVVRVDGDPVCVNMGIMWARRQSPLLETAQHKARALWEGRRKTWTGLRSQRGYQDNQFMIQDEFVRKGLAEILHPSLTSPFPRWNTQWQSQSVGRELYGVTLRDHQWISASSFTCNAWEGCWTNSQSDELAEWVLSRNPSEDPGESLGSPAAKLRAAADVVVGSQRALTDSGVPIAIAFRAMAAAINAIHRSRGRSDLARRLPADDLALAFLIGALKCEWGDSTQDANCTSLQGCLCGLRARMGESQAAAVACDMVFCDGLMCDDDELEAAFSSP